MNDHTADDPRELFLFGPLDGKRLPIPIGCMYWDVTLPPERLPRCLQKDDDPPPPACTVRYVRRAVSSGSGAGIRTIQVFVPDDGTSTADIIDRLLECHRP